MRQHNGLFRVTSGRCRATGLFSLAAAVSASLWSIEALAQDQSSKAGSKESDKENQTITVTGRGSKINRTVDSTIYDTKDNAQAQAGTAADVLNTIPSVNISGDGNVTVRGNGNVQVYVNGKPAASMQGDNRATTLQAMSGGSIAGVEVITNPSAKYDANGGAIVNLILKKDATAGVHGNVAANVGDRRRANLAVNGSYGGKNLTGTLNVSVRDDVRLTEIIGDRQLKSDGGAIIDRNVRIARYTPTHAYSVNLNGSVGYTLTPSSELGADFSVERGSPKNRVYEHRVDYDPDGDVTAEYDRIRSGTYYGRSHDASVFYQERGTGNGGSLKIAAQSGANSVRADRPFETSYVIPQAPRTAERLFNSYVSRLQRLSIDYERPLGGSLRLSIGSELRRDTIHLDNGRSPISPDSLGELGPPPISSSFEAAQMKAAAYVTVQARFDQWTVQAGERGQIVAIDAHAAPGAPLRNRRITGANHSLSIARDIGAAQLSVKLSRTQQLFDPRDLNPQVTYIDPANRSIGNPGLLPQEVTSIEGGYSISKGDRSASASLYYKRVDDTVVGYNSYLPDNVQVSAKQNSGTAASYGLEATLSDAMTRTLDYSVTGNVFHSELPVLDDGGVRRMEQRFSYIAQFSLDWKPTARNQIHLDGSAQGPTIVPQGVKSGTGALNIVWRHTFSPSLTLSVTGQNVVQTNYITTRVTTPIAFDVSRSLNGRRAIFVGVKCKIR